MPRRRLSPLDWRHGSPNGYFNYGCRCVPCKAAAREYQKGTRARRLARPIPDLVHGTYNGYTNYSCRCEECREANRVYMEGKRERDRQGADS